MLPGPTKDSPQLVNFHKLEKTSSLILELMLYQKTSYSLSSVPEMQSYIKDFAVLDENSTYNLSLQCEPRE